MEIKKDSPFFCYLEGVSCIMAISSHRITKSMNIYLQFPTKSLICHHWSLILNFKIMHPVVLVVNFSQILLLMVPTQLKLWNCWFHWLWQCGTSTGRHWDTWVQDTCPPELQRRSSKVLEKRSLLSLLKVGNLYQASTTLGLEPVSIVHYTRPGSSIKRPTPN